MRDVALDLALEDEVGQDALGLVAVDVVGAHLLQGHQESVDGHLVGLQQEMHLLEQVSGAETFAIYCHGQSSAHQVCTHTCT